LSKSILHNPLDKPNILRLLQATLRRSLEALNYDVNLLQVELRDLRIREDLLRQHSNEDQLDSEEYIRKLKTKIDEMTIQFQNQLMSQLLGRLLFSSDFGMHEILDNIRVWQENTRALWLEPIVSSFPPPRTFLFRNLKNPELATTLAINPTSSKLVSGSRRGDLNIWNLDEEEEFSYSTTPKHWKEVNILAVTPDSKKIVSASSDYKIKVWDINSGNLLLDLVGHKGLINSITITPDSREIISASDDCTLRHWSLEDENPAKSSKKFGDAVMNSIITDDGQYVFFSVDTTIKIWDLSSDIIREFSDEHTSKVNILRLFPDQQRIVSTSDDTTIRIWSIDQKICQQQLNGYRPSNLVVTPDDQFIVFVDDDAKLNAEDKNLNIWNWRSNEVKPFEGHSDPINSLAILPNGKWLITASKDKSIKIWDITSQNLLERISCNNEEPLALAVTPSGKQFIFSLDNKDLQIWDILEDQADTFGEVYGVPIRSIESIQNGEAIISTSDELIQIWQADSGSLLKSFKSEIWRSAYAIDENRLIFSSGESGELTVHQLNTECTKEKSSKGHSKRINAIVMTVDGKYAISASDDDENSNLIVWNLEEGGNEYLKGHASPVVALSLNIENDCLISMSIDKTVVWNLKTFKVLYKFIGESTLIERLLNENLKISPKDRYGVSGVSDTELTIWNLSNGEQLFSLERQNVSAIAIIISNERLISASDEGLEIWSTQDKAEPLNKLLDYSATINAIAATPCGRFAITASDDRTIKVWELRRAELVATFTGDSGMTSCAVAIDGVTIFAGDRSGRVHCLKLQGL
jgi:WD40 repeat protein